MAEKDEKAMAGIVDEISDRVKESLDQDLIAWRRKMYEEVKDEVKEHLSALRDSDNALNLRVLQYGDSLENLATQESLDNLAARVEKLTSEEGVPPPEGEKPKVEVEAKTELKPGEEEGLGDILVVCDHGGKGKRTGFTQEDKKAGVTFCPQCARRITYG